MNVRHRMVEGHYLLEWLLTGVDGHFLRLRVQYEAMVNGGGCLSQGEWDIGLDSRVRFDLSCWYLVLIYNLMLVRR